MYYYLLASFGYVVATCVIGLYVASVLFDSSPHFVFIDNADVERRVELGDDWHVALLTEDGHASVIDNEQFLEGPLDIEIRDDASNVVERHYGCRCITVRYC